jgi:hypothetical protein
VISTETAGHRHAGIPRLQAGEDVKAYLMDHERIRGLDRGMLHHEASAVTAEGRPESADWTSRHREVVR